MTTSIPLAARVPLEKLDPITRKLVSDIGVLVYHQITVIEAADCLAATVNRLLWAGDADGARCFLHHGDSVAFWATAAELAQGAAVGAVEIDPLNPPPATLVPKRRLGSPDHVLRYNEGFLELRKALSAYREACK